MRSHRRAWKVDKPRDAGSRSDGDRQARRQMAGERVVGKQPEKQTDNQGEGEGEAASQSRRSRQTGRRAEPRGQHGERGEQAGEMSDR